MDQGELLRHTVKALESAQIAYAVTGSQASSAYGENRFTNDIDVVASVTLATLPPFLAHFPSEDFYVSEEAARQAIAVGGQFNIIDPSSAQKVDVIIPATDFDRQALSRVRRLSLTDMSIAFMSPEDLIIKKMDFYREGGSEKHLRDITGMLLVSGEEIDHDYVDRWSGELALTEIWNAVQSRLRSP